MLHLKTLLLLFLICILSVGAAQAKSKCAAPSPGMVFVKGGSFTMGAGAQYPEETPSLITHVKSFYMSRTEVTNSEFSEFVEETGYITLAERQPDPDDYPNIKPTLLKPGSVIFDIKNTSQLWRFQAGASWKHPDGPKSSIKGKNHYPVVHIALEDAKAYSKWKGHRLPTEAEYEYASRGGLEGAVYESGATLKKDNQHIANTWQGFFPFSNSKEDGFEGLAPVGCYPANPYGLHDLIGNVWEWTQSTYYPNHYTAETLPNSMPDHGYDARQPGIPVSVIKGGSFLCAENFCMRYRPAARHAQETGLGTSHIGFRTVKDLE